MMKALVVGGSNGIGLAIAMCLKEKGYDVHIIDKADPDTRALGLAFERFDLTSDDYSIFDRHQDADVVMITAGFGHLALFDDIDETSIQHYFQVNAIAAIRIVKHFYQKLLSENPFRLGVMVSIAGFMSSPFLSVYGATKAALKVFIESVNVELEKAGSSNSILNVSPGSVKGTHFNGGQTNRMELVMPLAEDIVAHLLNGDDLFIPQYETVYRHVLERYHQDFRAEGRHSYDYKVQSGRMKR